ncbi:MAG: redoxin domain-containing protein [Patescibacteria group bacterium]|nr:redoxin domain-containing protein [Actinomycetota bacterium]MCL5438900.1 redoxin domain-containing protein [Patescibacteria group bacterium]
MRNKEGLIITVGFVVLAVIVVAVAFLLTGNSGPASQLGGQGSSANQSTAPAVLNSLVGKPAPDFTLESYDGKKITLSSLKGKNVILFFSEGLMCYPACWDQIAAFGKDNQFPSKETVVLTIVNDSKNDWKGAIEKMPELASAAVLFDTDKKVSASYNMLSLPSSMHKGQLPGHTYVVLDKRGIVRYVLDDPQMAIRNQQLLTEIDKF